MSIQEEIWFLYNEHLEYTRQYLWYQESKFSIFPGVKSKVEAERYRYLSNYYFQKLVEKCRHLMASNGIG